MAGSDSAAGDDGAAEPAAPPASDGQAAVVPLGGRRELARTAELGVEVAEPATAVRQIRTAVAAVGGFVTQERSVGAGSRLVLRVPAEALDRLIDDVGALGQVTARSGQVLDATEEIAIGPVEASGGSLRGVRIGGALPRFADADIEGRAVCGDPS